MRQVDIPESFQKELPGEIFTIGPPPGVSREHCVEAKVHVIDDVWNDGMGFNWTVFFELDKDDLDVLKLGGLIKMQMRGIGMVPHSLGTWNG